MEEPTPNSTGPILAQELKDLLSKNIEGNLQLLTRVSGMVKEAARSFGASAKRPQQPAEIITRLARLNLSYFSLLTKHGLAFADELTIITERALGIKADTARPPNASNDPGPARVEISLNAGVGETVAAGFLVENSQKKSVQVAFEASEIVSRQGEPIRSARVRFEPSRLKLKAGAKATVQALIPITEDFKPGELYLLRIRVVGFEKKEVWIGINILAATQERKSKPHAAKAAAKTAKGRKRS